MTPNARPSQICLKLLAAVGPLSWLLLGVYLLMTMGQMWVGLAALYYGSPIILVIHILAPLGLLWQLRHHHRASRRWVYWSLAYYGLMPIIIVGLARNSLPAKPGRLGAVRDAASQPFLVAPYAIMIIILIF